MIADSILAASAATGGFNIPVVIRLQGTNCEKGSKLIRECGLDNVLMEADFEEATKKIVKLTNN
jgi:succinyl-CoA synthetase beta subunit